MSESDQFFNTKLTEQINELSPLDKTRRLLALASLLFTLGLGLGIPVSQVPQALKHFTSLGGTIRDVADLLPQLKNFQDIGTLDFDLLIFDGNTLIERIDSDLEQ